MQCLPDIVEAYIGAIFIDSDFDYNRVQQFFNAHILPFFADLSIYDDFAKNQSITRMQHTISKIYGCQVYQLLCEQVDSNVIGGKSKFMAGIMVHKTLVASVVGESKRYPRERESKKAIEELAGLTVKEFRDRFECDCKTVEEEGG